MSRGVSLLRVDEAREEDGISDEEYWSVVAHQVPVSLLCVELDGKSPGITDSVCGATLSSNSGKSTKILYDRDRKIKANLTASGVCFPILLKTAALQYWLMSWVTSK